MMRVPYDVERVQVAKLRQPTCCCIQPIQPTCHARKTNTCTGDNLRNKNRCGTSTTASQHPTHALLPSPKLHATPTASYGGHPKVVPLAMAQSVLPHVTARKQVCHAAQDRCAWPCGVYGSTRKWTHPAPTINTHHELSPTINPSPNINRQSCCCHQCCCCCCCCHQCP